MKRIIAVCLSLSMLLPWAGTASAAEADSVQKIKLYSEKNGESDIHTALLNGNPVPEYDYTWHADPAEAHEEEKNAPAEYFTGTKPSGEDAVYIAHDIIYYPKLEENKFQKVHYDGEMEWVYPYEAEAYSDYLFSTLPDLKSGFPSHMMHSQEEAYQNAVLHITQPGTYELTGEWHGQIWIDLGDKDDVYTDSRQTVTLILNSVDITCTVAPAVVFASVYECDNDWESAKGYSQNVDTSQAGANVILADGTVNNVTGTNIFRILKTKFKDEDSDEEYPAQKKAWKIDGALYSFMSMNITGEAQGSGVLNVTSGFEGIGSEHHLTINGGNVYVYSQDDGINVNEDDVSVLTVNGGNLHICAGLGNEGDGIDSNGFLVINGGTVITSAHPASDSGLDSDCGSFVNGGTVVALGAAMDWAEADETSDSQQPVLNLRFSNSQNADEAIVITNTENKVVFAYDPDKDEVNGENHRTYQGAIVSGPCLKIGGEYHIFIGGDVAGSEISGVYQTETITGFSEANQQCWSGTVLGGHGGGKSRPDFAGRGDPMPPERPERGKRPAFDQPLPDMFEQQRISPAGAGGSCTCSTIFTLQQQVNAFSSVTDYRKTAEGDLQCAVCGRTIGADNQSAQLTDGHPENSIDGTNTLLVVAALLTVGCLILWLLMKKKEQNGNLY